MEGHDGARKAPYVKRKIAIPCSKKLFHESVKLPLINKMNYHKIDKSDMFQSIFDFPNQLENALKIVSVEISV